MDDPSYFFLCQFLKDSFLLTTWSLILPCVYYLQIIGLEKGISIVNADAKKLLHFYAIFLIVLFIFSGPVSDQTIFKLFEIVYGPLHVCGGGIERMYLEFRAGRVVWNLWLFTSHLLQLFCLLFIHSSTHLLFIWNMWSMGCCWYGDEILFFQSPTYLGSQMYVAHK